MKFTTVIDRSRAEEVLIYAKERTPLVEEIEAICAKEDLTLIGYEGTDIIPLEEKEITCFTVEDRKIYAIVKGRRIRVNERLYRLEERLSSSFVKINQSCLVNVNKIARFSATIGGSLAVICKDGYRDYVSRRQLKAVKERIGFTL